MNRKEKDWQCDFCRKEKDTLYFEGKKQICEECRRKVRKDTEDKKIL